jgi:hypothetical protein
MTRFLVCRARVAAISRPWPIVSAAALKLYSPGSLSVELSKRM